MASQKTGTADAPPPSLKVPRRIRTRRKLWLAAHPEYFTRASHSLALPLAYDRLVRTYQSAAERQDEGKRQGWARMLEGALLRGEAKREAAVTATASAGGLTEKEGEEDEDGPENRVVREGLAGTHGRRRKGLRPLPEEEEMETDAGEVASTRVADIGPAKRRDIHMSELRDRLVDDGDLGGAVGQASHWDIPLGLVPTDEVFEAGSDRVDGLVEGQEPISTEDDRPLRGDDPVTGPDAVVDHLDKMGAMRRWTELLRARLVAGADDEFDYNAVDFDDTLDGEWDAARKEEEWFEDEPEAWVSNDLHAKEELEGETGVQDF